MRLGIRYIILGFLAFIISFSGFSQSVYGKIVDRDNNPLSYVNIHKVGSGIGVATNLEGYYSLNLGEGRHIIEYRMIGFRTITDTIYIGRGKRIRRNFGLEEDIVELGNVDIIYGEDPAVPIIRKVIENRERYLNENLRYTSQNFTKSIYKFTGYDMGERVFGIKLPLAKRVEIDSMIRADFRKNDGYFYSSESETVLYKDNKRQKEVMVSSRVSGDPKQFSFNFSQNYALNFYENLIDLSFSDKYFVSPIASYAFGDYRYFLIGKFEDGNHIINKIKVVPKNSASNCFYGYIYIIDSLWRLQGVDLNIRKENNLVFIDSINIKQTYTEVEEGRFKPISNIQRAYANIEIMGLNIFAVLDFNSISQGFDFEPVFSKDLFSKELISINRDANIKDSLYWEENSPLPYTDIEKAFYAYEDSIYRINSHPDTIRSRDRKINKFSIMNLITGYNYRNSLKNYSYSINALNSLVFNTVQGWNMNIDSRFRKNISDNNSILLGISPGYGFSDKTLRLGTSLRWDYDKERLARVVLRAGVNEAVNISGYSISPFLNTFYSELFASNEMKLYSKTYFHILYYRELITGLDLNLSSEIGIREALVNHSSPKWTSIGSYTSNNPLSPNNNGLAFARNNSFIIEGELSWNPFMKYASIPNKVRIRSDFPIFYFRYKRSIPLEKEDWSDYELVEFKADYNLDLGRMGKGKMVGVVGKFLRTEDMIFADYKHYNGNRFHIGTFANESFRVLPYYKHSTNGNYIEAHYTHRFNRWLFSKLPLIKKTMLSEEFSMHLLSNNLQNPYMEISLGASNIFKVLSLNYSCGFQRGDKPYHGITLSVGISL